MSSYYREHVSFPNVTSGPAPPYPPPLTAVNDAHDFGRGDTNGVQQQEGSNARHCSVKGCAAVLAPTYPHKMCEECRGRHRIYANTKRAKRKMEKALLNSGQPVAWMPDDGASQQEEQVQPDEPVAGPSRSFMIAQTNDENSQSFDYSQGWDPRALDPSLFSQASELAGALTLPHGHAHSGDHNLFEQTSYQLHHLQQQAQQQHHVASLHHAQQTQHHPQPHQSTGPPPPPSAPEIHPVLAEVLRSVPHLTLSTRITSGPTVPVGASAPPVDGQLPPRFCSIKGCKTLIAGNSFFKMCEPCRNRYRNYGTTKRAKWRKEKEVVVHELRQLREEEDKRRAEQGLPPLPPEDDEIWHEYAASPPDGSGSGEAGPSAQGSADTPRPPRMCTVSHCREILPGDYQYLRCERHRIQNRHHSKLKRVRDKEVKAQVYDGWAAAAGLRDASSGDADDMEDDEGSMSPGEQETDVQLQLEDIERHLRDASLDPEYALPPVVAESGVMGAVDSGVAADGEPLDETPLGEPMHGVPPAARGSRRTNHVCSIRACANLLSPSNPWKMCDLCRSRDRAGRRLKALRDSGLVPPEVADPKLERMRLEVEGKGSRSTPSRLPGEKKSKKRKKKGEAADVKGGGDGDAQGGGEIFAGFGGGETAGGVVNAMVSMDAVADEASDGSIAPSALQRVLQGSQSADAGSSTSVFSSIPTSDQSSIVFMDPLSPEHAAQIEAQHEKIRGAPSTIGPTGDESLSASLGNGNGNSEHTGKDDGITTASATSVPKKRGKGKAKSKANASSQQNTNEPPPIPQALDASNGLEPQAADAAPPSGTDASQLAPPHQYPSGYPYYMQPSYMPYPPPPNYGYPYSPPKGSYPPPPPMYAPPYGAYPYPYPGQPYGYPAPYPPPPGHPYPPPPPPGQGYPAQSSPPQGQAYLPPQPYPYSHAYPPPPYQSPPALPRPPQTEQIEQQGEQQQQHQEQSQQQQPIMYKSSPPTLPKTQQESADYPETSAPSSSEPGRPQHPQRFSTFIVRTEEAYQTGPHGNVSANSVPGAKRKRDEGELECGSGSAYSKFKVQAPVPPGASMGVQMMQLGHHLAGAAESPQLAQVPQPTTSPSFDKISSCSNKNCKRLLSAGCSGLLCDRCKERLKKKQAKAKHRFKLEPKSLLGRAASVQPSGSGSATPGVAVQVAA